MTSHDHENPESQMFGLVERLNRADAHLMDIVSKRTKPAKHEGQLVGEMPDLEMSGAAESLIEVIDNIVDDIYKLLPSKENISDQEKVVWTGSLRDLMFEYLGDNHFKIEGLHLADRENIESGRTDDQVSVTISNEIELSVDPQEILEALTGTKTKIYRI